MRDFGYDAGGYDFETPGYTSVVERIDYSNDTATAAVKGPLSAAKSGTQQQAINPLVTLVVEKILLLKLE